jgi:hypothetical protein
MLNPTESNYKKMKNIWKGVEKNKRRALRRGILKAWQKKNNISLWLKPMLFLYLEDDDT